MAVIIRPQDGNVVNHQNGTRGVAFKNKALLNNLVRHSKDTMEFIRGQVGHIHLAEIEIADDGTIIINNSKLADSCEAAKAAATPKHNCICGLGC